MTTNDFLEIDRNRSLDCETIFGQGLTWKIKHQDPRSTLIVQLSLKQIRFFEKRHGPETIPPNCMYGGEFLRSFILRSRRDVPLDAHVWNSLWYEPEQASLKKLNESGINWLDFMGTLFHNAAYRDEAVLCVYCLAGIWQRGVRYIGGHVETSSFCRHLPSAVVDPVSLM